MQMHLMKTFLKTLNMKIVYEYDNEFGHNVPNSCSCVPRFFHDMDLIKETMKHRLVCFLMLFLGLDPQLCQGE